MTLTKDEFWTLVGQTIMEPRMAARSLVEARVPHAALWPLLLLVVLASTLLSGGLNLLSPAQGPMAMLLTRPFVSAFVTLAGLALMIYALHWTGRVFGGAGDLPDMLLVMTWLQFMLFLGQIGILVVALVVPPLGAFLFLIYLGFSVWMAVAFVDAVHAFDSYLKSFGVILLALLAIGIGLSILFSMLGLSAPGVPANV